MHYSHTCVFLQILGEHEARVQRYKDNLAKEEGQGDDASTQIAYEEKLGELTSEATEASEHLSTLHGELKIAISPKKQQEHSVKRKQLEVKSAKKNLTFAMRELQNMRNEVMQKKGSADDEETQRQAKAKKAEEAMEEARKVVDESRGGIEASCQRYEEGSSREDVANGSLNAVNAQCGAVQRKIQELKASQGNSLTIFGSTCEAMNRAVLQAQGSGKFRGKVIGPIGKYMKIIPGKEHLASVAEKALGLNLDRYIVTNSHDRQVFLKLRQQVRCGYSDSGVYQMVSVLIMVLSAFVDCFRCCLLILLVLYSSRLVDGRCKI
jgi:chromosome segregation ATPase